MKNQPESTSALGVSVALASYNGERYLDEQLTSILSQSRMPDEIVVADDGSTDDTVSIVTRAFAVARELGIRTTLLTGTTPLGVTANFVRALRATTGQLIVLSDQDDRWQQHRIREAVAVFARQPTLLFQHENARLIDAAGTNLPLTLFEALGVTPQHRRIINGGDAFDLFLRRNLATGATVSFRRELFERALPFPPEWVHDEWLAIIAAALGAVAVSDSTTVEYRQHSSNEIGVAAPTLQYRIRRMLASDPKRNEVLARRSEILADRLGDLAGVAQSVHAAATNKARFERQRSQLPRRRVARIAAIWRANRRRGYARFASQGRLDMARDLLQPRPM